MTEIKKLVLKAGSNVNLDKKVKDIVRGYSSVISDIPGFNLTLKGISKSIYITQNGIMICVIISYDKD